MIRTVMQIGADEIAWITIERSGEGPDGSHQLEYHWSVQVSHAQGGGKRRGFCLHREEDGAVVLLQKVLTHYTKGTGAWSWRAAGVPTFSTP